MTICISILCEEEDVALVGADRMITEHRIPIEFETDQPKFSPYKNEEVRFAFSSAGSALSPASIKQQLGRNIDSIDTVRQAANFVKSMYIDIKRSKFEEQVLAQRGLTIDEFYENRMHDSGRGKEWDRLFSDFSLDLDIMITGHDSTGINSYRISDGSEFNGLLESFTNLGFDAVGSGSSLARDTLTSRYSSQLTTKEGIYVLFTALKNASQAPGVGNTFDITIIDPDGPRQINEEMKDTLNTIYYENEQAQPTPDDLEEVLDL